MNARYIDWLAGGLAGTLLLAWIALDPTAPRRAGAYVDSPPAGRTGAPAEGTCGSCHSGGLNDGQGTLAFVGVPSSYTPGQTYPITVSLARSGALRWGFESTALNSSDNSAAGSFALTSNLTLLQSKSGKSYVSQTNLNGPDGTYPGTPDGPVSWSFNWTAPSAGAGAVTFYAVGVAADNDGNDGGGDLVYTVSTGASEGSPTPASSTTWGKIKALYLH